MKNPHARSMYKRLVITIPGHLAVQINSICEADGLNHSAFSCAAAQAYLAAKSCEPQYTTPTDNGEFMDNPAHIFSEWSSMADRVYDTLTGTRWG